MRKTQSDKISVVLCSYNGAAFLKQQIDSILNQTYTNVELIISDDGSTDNTRTILSQYTRTPNIKIILREQNIGYSDNFFQTALLAEGGYVAFADQDDIWLPNKLQTLYNSINDYYLVYSDSLLIDEEGKPLNKKLSDLRNMGEIKDIKGFLLSNPVWGHTMMIRKELLNYTGFLPDGISYDIWLAIKATLRTGVAYVNEPLTFYRQHKGSVTKTLTEKVSGSRKRIKRYEEYAGLLKWLAILKDNELTEQSIFFHELYSLFIKKEQKTFVWPLFFFLFEHQKEIFSFRKKNFWSRLIEIRKLARGERGKTENILQQIRAYSTS